MKIHYLGKVSLLTTGLLMGCFISIPAQTQEIDSLHQSVSTPSYTDNTHNLRLKEVLIPTGVVGASALFVHNEWLAKQRKNAQDVLSAKGKHKIKIDDYSQYAPMITVYGLNLLGIKGKHRFVDRTILLAMSYATMGILINSMKFTFKEVCTILANNIGYPKTFIELSKEFPLNSIRRKYD